MKQGRKTQGSTDRCIAYAWGTTPEERRMDFPCDRYLADSDSAYFRAVDVYAPDYVLFRWLCQLKAAPYSYDWIDNFGRQSPGKLIPGLDRLQAGQRVMSIFKLVAFAHNRHITLVMDDVAAIAIFGHIALSYVVVPKTDRMCRLVVKLLIRYPTNLLGPWVRRILPWGDMVMMRKQLLTLKRLAEQKEG